MNGQLREHPLAELIREIGDAELSGALRLAHERIKAVVYFDNGGVVYATSNLRAHRLAECARRSGLLTPEQLAGVRQNVSDPELGLAFVARGDLKRAQLDALLSGQAAEVLRAAMLWTEGAWDFDPRVRLTVEIRAHVDAQELLMESARRLPAEFIAGRFARTTHLSPAGSEANGLTLLPSEGFLLSRVDAPISLEELTAISGMPEADALRALYALVLGGLLAREQSAAPAFTSEHIAKSRSIKSAPQKDLHARLVAAESVFVKKKPEERAAAGAAAPPTPADKPKEVNPRQQQQEVEGLFARLAEAQNYYQVLDVGRFVEQSEIKHAYHGLARRFHPDRFHKESDPELYARVEDAFARIAHAYETLRDTQARATYDRTLEAQLASAARNPQATKPEQTATNAQRAAKANQAPGQATQPSTPLSDSSDPEEIYHQGMNALQQGNRTLALACLAEAARRAPQQSRYRAQYGRALAASERTRRQAEAEFLAAISLDKGNAYYRVMLAKLYSDLGHMKRAQSELERAINIDPHNQAARLLLQKLKG